jgi:hypothetical protein
MATSVAAGFTELLNRLALTDRQRSTAKSHIENIISFFTSNFVLASAGVFYTGSYRRGTMVRPTRDVDILAALSVKEYDGTYGDDSSKFLYMVRNALNDRYGATTVSSKRVAVKLDFSDVVADVVPCFPRQGGGFLMPNGTGGWRGTNPPVHTRLMREADEAQTGRLKPVVKLLKAWNIQNGYHLSSIHVELMVERMWRGSGIGSVLSSAVAKTLKTVPSWLSSSFPDPWPDGQPIDSDLSSAERALAIRLLKEDAGRAANAEEDRLAGRIKQAFERWDVVYRDSFPAYG